MSNLKTTHTHPHPHTPQINLKVPEIRLDTSLANILETSWGTTENTNLFDNENTKKVKVNIKIRVGLHVDVFAEF